MSDIEVTAKPFLAPMILDEPIILDIDAQRCIAKWLGLKAIVEHYARSAPPPSERWYEQFYKGKEPPTGWQIRIGHYTGTRQVFWGAADLDTTNVHPLSPFTVKQRGFIFTVSVGHFIGQVIGMNTQAVLTTNRRYFVQIWPHPLLRFGGPVRTLDPSEFWPPEGGLDDTELKKCSRDPAEPKS